MGELMNPTAVILASYSRAIVSCPMSLGGNAVGIYICFTQRHQQGNNSLELDLTAQCDIHPHLA